jgi:hypothetical protein
MKKIILITFFSLLSFIGYAQIEGPPTPPPCPTMQMVQFCFTNSTGLLYPCEKTVCMTFTPKPNKQAELAGCFYDPNAFCITIAPGSSDCISIPTPGLPITDWYDLTVSVRSNPTSATPTFNLEPGFISSSGGLGAQPWYAAPGGCRSGDYTSLETEDGYNYIIKNTIHLGE